MAKLQATRSYQKPRVVTFGFKMTDTMVNTAGAEVTIGAAGANVFDVASIPADAVIVGGNMAVLTASNDATTSTVTIGTDSDADVLRAATDAKTVAVSELTQAASAGSKIRVTVTNGTGGATAGEVYITVMYIEPGRADGQYA